jgi:GTPase SAR1 family protein
MFSDFEDDDEPPVKAQEVDNEDSKQQLKSLGFNNIILVGTKLDMEDERQVEYDEAIAMAEQLNLAGVIETSAKTGSKDTTEDINDCFRILALNCFEKKTGIGILSEASNSEQNMIRLNAAVGGASTNYERQSDFKNEYALSVSTRYDYKYKFDKTKGHKLEQPQDKP